MSKNKQPKAFTSIDAWSEHYLPGHAAIEREARAPFEEVINHRVVEILVERSNAGEHPDLAAIKREAREPFEPAIQGIIAEKLYERVAVTL